ncbi:MAG: tRNA (N(6)-L-threonylcarbamoyladenosine(37)-C(2))-methylthiotransferase MtaB [Ruminococcus sp.]|nr:tRNA (N(6)-L-threonylcarbamoyladenosine(37)-C(2))-methylthiotransferase MtaB [Ruminococcus sp.]
MYNVFFISFGCKVNLYETECMKSAFREAGFGIAGERGGADAVVINSCTVTSSGDSRVLAALRKTRAALPEAVIALTGCYPQANPDEAASLSEADIITGTKDRSKLPALVEECLKSRSRMVAVPEYVRGDGFECLTLGTFEDNTRAFLKIQDGCDQFCSYCMIPFARGRSRSKPIAVIADEARRIAESGRKEIVLAGINLAFYGRELGLTLADAAEVCARTDGIERVRLGSLEPEMMSGELLQRLAALPEMCPQFHLSLQSGCTRTLRAMNRHYTVEEYAELMSRIRRYFPECAFTTDIMVGFPQETDADFAESLEFVKNAGFSRVHVFRYSRRKGTAADRMSGQIPESVKTERAELMSRAAAESGEKYLRSLVGRTVPVLFERESTAGYHQGHAPDGTLIKTLRKNPQKSLRNRIFCATIEESRSDYCLGTILNNI